MNRTIASVTDAFERALGDILARVSVWSGREVRSLAIAYSGGLDSSVLLDLVRRYADQHRIQPIAFHVHHGLSRNADDWLAHCERQCRQHGIDFDSRRITLTGQSGNGVEEAARLRRYAALGELCRLYQVPLLLTAHHQDDQAETVLLQLLRGAGVAGLGGMEQLNRAPSLLGSPDLHMGRPLLAVSRASLEEYARDLGITHVEDESNLDSCYARNALRHHVLPVLEQFFPGGAERIARTGQHARAAHRLLQEMAASDLDYCGDGQCLFLSRLRTLSHDRIDNVLRHWIASRGLQMPSTAWLAEMREQVFDAKEDARLGVTYLDHQVRRHRDRIYLVQMREMPGTATAFRWEGQASMAFPEWGGVLHFDREEEGIDGTWLQGQELVLHPRLGGERLKPAANRPTRSLKHHYQALDIPFWERERLPLLSTSGGELLFAAGVGMDCRHFSSNSTDKICCRWVPD